jgi:hypothetical protein
LFWVSQLVIDGNEDSGSSPGRSPWTPSYSVSRQGSPALQIASLPDEGEVEAKEAGNVSSLYRPRSCTSNLPCFQVVNSIESNGSPRELGWTPSYSVSRQGSPSPESRTPVQASQVDTGKDGVAAKTNISTDQDRPTSIEAIIVPTPMNPLQSADNITGLEVKDPSAKDTPERPRSPWSPSYSVTRQGSRIFDQAPVTDATSDSLCSFPTAEDDATTTDFHRLEKCNLIRHLEMLKTSSTRSMVTQETDIATVSPRTRYESLTSSLHFPPTAKAQEGRMSLDKAQGEFVSSKPSSPVEEKTSETMPSIPGDLLADGGESSDASGNIQTQEKVEAAGDDKKGRWCVVM